MGLDPPLTTVVGWAGLIANNVEQVDGTSESVSASLHVRFSSSRACFLRVIVTAVVSYDPARPIRLLYCTRRRPTRWSRNG